jgi:signal transduction histidine kinase
MMKLKIKFFRQTKGLAFKLILFFFTSVAIIFSIAFLYTYNISRKIVEKNLRQNAASLTTGAVIKVDKALGSVQKIADNYAKITEGSDYSRDELINILKLLVGNNPEIFGAGLMFEPYYMDPSLKYNTLYAYRKDKSIEIKPFGENVDYFTMDYYQIPRELNRSVWSEPYYDVGVGNVVMTTYSVPLYKYKDGKAQLVGVLGVDISLDWLQEYLNSIKIYKTGYAFLISSIGTNISHPNKSVIMDESIFSIADAQNSRELREIGRNMINGKTSFAEMEYHNLLTGKLSWIAYAPVPANNWSVGIVFPVEELMADVNNLFVNLLIIGIGGLVILLILIILISRSITSPLRTLTHAAGRFAEGDFNVELPKIKTHDEIGKLNASFIYMQNTLASTIRDLREASSELKISNEKLEEYSRTLEEKVEERTATLKAAQKQLVQSEKMASLGQLTAGIAHEIKNPLNFVNNLSELSIGLAGELIEEIDKLSGTIDAKDSDNIRSLLSYIETNVVKINEHGKRADSIIRGMLLHSRGKSGEMQPTDLNALLAEYVALGYHGMRATDSTFNIKIETEYDPSIGMVSVVPQDISRVFLNLINNACYSTAQKKKELKESYFPIMRIRTQKTPDKIIIQIWDNGKGIQRTILEKIFNPFFTTKPAGSGTGLGLSISYDIVVQEHHGEIKADSKEGEYAEFFISLPNKI